MPKAIGFPTAYNFQNMLAGLTPTFTNWATNPGTNADITNELTVLLTTPGVGAFGVNSIITYDLGQAFRVLASMFNLQNTASDAYIYASLDNITYYLRAYAVSNTVHSAVAAMYARYVRFVPLIDIHTTTQLSLVVYRI